MSFGNRVLSEADEMTAMERSYVIGLEGQPASTDLLASSSEGGGGASLGDGVGIRVQSLDEEDFFEDEEENDDGGWWEQRWPRLLLPKLRGGGGEDVYQDMVTSIASGTAKTLLLVVAVFMIQSGARSLAHSQQFGGDYIFGAAAMGMGVAMFFNTVAGLIGLWRYHQNDENYDSQLLKWTHAVNLWLLLAAVTHGLAVLRYFKNPPDQGPILLTNPAYNVTRFWVSVVDLVAVTLLLLDLVGLLLKDPLNDSSPHELSVTTSAMILAGCAVGIITLTSLVFNHHTNDETTPLHWPIDYSIYCSLAVWCIVIILLIPSLWAQRSLSTYGWWVFAMIGILSIVFTALTNKRKENGEFVSITVLISIGAQPFVFIITVALISLRAKHDRDLASLRRGWMSLD